MIFIRLTKQLQKRIVGLANIVRDQELPHVVMPLLAADRACPRITSIRQNRTYSSTTGSCLGRRDLGGMEPEVLARGRSARAACHQLDTAADVIPVDFLSSSDKVLSPVICGLATKPYADRLRALQGAEWVHEMMSTAA